MSETNGTRRAVDPIKLQAIDGQELQFLLSAWELKQLRIKLGIKSVELLSRITEVYEDVLFASLLDKPEGMTEEQFLKMLPGHMENNIRASIAILGSSLPDARPMQASETTTLQ